MNKDPTIRGLQLERYEFSEVEQDAERAALFSEPGSWFHRLMSWVVKQCRESREDIDAEINSVENSVKK